MNLVRDNYQIQMWPVERLLPYARNARTHTDEQVAQIAASIVEFKWTNPLLVGENGVIIAGHARLEAARKLGMKEIPVIVLNGLTETQRRALVIADNQLAIQGAGWDEEMLRVELQALQEDGFDLDIVGFSDEELEALLAEPEAEREGLTDEDAVPEEPEEAVTKPGDLWLLGEHRLLCGDATLASDVERALNGKCPILMTTDPPYGVEYDPEWRADAGVNKNQSKLGRVENDDRADWREAWTLFPGDVMYVWHAGRHAATVQQSIEACRFEIRSQIIWAKERFALSRGNYHWQHEPCWYAVRNNAHWNGDRSQSTLWKISAREDDGHGHGTQKPVECMRRPMLNNSRPGQVVYDPFLGSGTSIIAAETIKRICYGLEINAGYCDIALRRWQTFTGKASILEKDGRTFDQISQARTAACA
ncbi:MAG: site-specific DNA-methyltransferase [Bryobacteraceae bacterium]|nr:site-specific DNA-methyltransferase [Bryobacteraceae bacterium]